MKSSRGRRSRRTRVHTQPAIRWIASGRSSSSSCWMLKTTSRRSSSTLVGSGEQPGAERALDVALEAHGQAGGHLTGRIAENRVQVPQEWCWTAMGRHVGGDADLGVRAVDRAVEHRPLVVVE